MIERERERETERKGKKDRDREREIERKREREWQRTCVCRCNSNCEALCSIDCLSWPSHSLLIALTLSLSLASLCMDNSAIAVASVS